MKSFIAFAAILALAAGYPAVSTWTLNELSEAIQDPDTDPKALPYLDAALNELMSGLVMGDQQTSIVVSIPVTTTMTLDELSSAVHDPYTSPAVLPYLEDALHELMVAMFNEEGVTSISVHIPAMNVNMWTLDQLSTATQDPATDPELLIYLEHALNELMKEIFSGHQTTTIAVVTPPGVVAVAPGTVAPVIVAPEIVAPEVVDPVIVVPEAPEIAPEPVVVGPTPADVEAVASSPLVQLIVNVNA